jgi:hypothetical protein
MGLVDAKAQKGQRKADAVTTGDELLGEKDYADRAEQVQRPRDRPRDQQGGKRALR